MNRQPRALLSVLLIGLVAFLGWRWWTNERTDDDGATQIVFSEAATRGGTLASSLRSEPRSFNRIMGGTICGMLGTIVLTQGAIHSRTQAEESCTQDKDIHIFHCRPSFLGCGEPVRTYSRIFLSGFPIFS